MPMLTLLGPILVKLLTTLYDRLVLHWKSSTIGVTVGGGMYTALSLFGCDTTLLSPAIIGAIAAAPKLLGTDADKIAPSLWAAITETIQQEKRSRQVTADAQRQQDDAAKKFNIPSWLPLILLGMALSACSAVQMQKAQAVIVKLKADAQKVAIIGCQNYPTVDVLMETALALLPAGTTIDAIEQGYRVAEPQIEAFCRKLQERLLPAPPLPDAVVGPSAS